MNHSCELQAVVVSTDAGLVESISSCLSDVGITTGVHREISSALKTLGRQKTDAFFVDRELDPEFEVLKGMRASPSSRAAVAFALLPKLDPPGKAFRVADFILDKPLENGRVSRALRAAYGIMLKERLRYFRHPLELEATLVDSMQRSFRAQINNISQSGLGLESTAEFIPREMVQLHFSLPGDEQKLSCQAQVIWTADRGKAGLRYTHFSNGDRARLTEWVESQFLRQWQPLVAMGTGRRLADATA